VCWLCVRGEGERAIGSDFGGERVPPSPFNLSSSDIIASLDPNKQKATATTTTTTTKQATMATSGAKSLKCVECGSLFLSVQEAQTHGELTKHARFDESEERVQVSICLSCGKPARSDADRALHERHTGHREWRREEDGAAVLGGGAAGGIVNTEAQMAAAKAQAQAEAEADMELLGIKKKTGKVESAAAGGGGEGAGGGGAAAAGPSSQQQQQQADASSPNENDLVPVSVDASALSELQAMGFGEHRAARALHATGNAGVEAAVGWLADHENSATAEDGSSLDAPLLVKRRDAAATGGSKSTMSSEEARQKAKEMMARARERREREERESAARRERDRIRAGKELQAALRQEEEGKFKRMAEERRREKEEEERARQALRLKLEEDRKARRRRLGLPEELTEEEKKQEAEKRRLAQEQAEKERREHGPPPATAAALATRQRDQLRGILVAMKKGAPEGEEQFKTCARTLGAYVRNLGASGPGSAEENKFRRINRSNAAFQSRVACLPQGEEFLAAIGFAKAASGGGGEDGGDFLVVPQGEVDRARLGVAAAALDDALTNPFFGVL
jgi:hypothetical protein